ncbi:dipeptide/heme ABC transporter periplasmic binding protein [Gammaproteobacteria bacterium]|nr:dipeptide/heme ABC transporter periplasmic binding protein [Gammaproteobacteria bacterium]
MSKKLTVLNLSLIIALSTLGSTALAAKNFIFCSEASPEGFNPMLYTSGTTNDATAETIYDRLTQFDEGSTELNLDDGLAEKIDISDDGLEYIFHLRHGVKFQANKEFTPTRDFNADDVVFSFERQRDPNHPFAKVSGGNYEYFIGMAMEKTIKKVSKIDENTVKFELNMRDAAFLANLAMAHSSIQSAEYADKMLAAKTPERIDQSPIGTGPFELVQYIKDSQVRYKAFENHWRGKQKIENLIYSITPDASVRFAKLQKGECHVTLYPNPADIDAMRKDENLQVLEQAGLNVGYLAFNTLKKPFDDVRVRQALSMLVHKPEIIDAVYQGSGIAAKNPIPPTIWSYNDKIVDYQYDLEKAKALLKEAGYENGFETDLWAMPVQRPYNPNARRMAEMIQADWQKAGIKVTIKTFEWAEYLQGAKDGQHQTVLLGWTGDNGDPDNFLATLLSCASVEQGSNYAKWCYKPYDDLVVAARQETDHAKRIELYEQAQQVFHDQAPWIPIAHSKTIQPLRANVVNFKVSPLGRNSFKNVDLKE